MKTFKKFGIITVCCLVLTAACKDGDNPAENSDPVSYNLTVLVSPNTAAGSVLKMPDKTAYSSGTEVTLAAQANAGYLFDSWSGELGSSSNTVQLIMDSDKMVTANFIIEGTSSSAASSVSSAANSAVSSSSSAAVSSSSSVSSAALSVSSSSSSAGSGFTFNPASPVYYDDGFPDGWVADTQYGVFDYTADYNYTADTPAGTASVIRLTDSSAAWTGLWINSSDAGTLDLNTLSSKSLVFDMKVPDSVNVKFESDAGANGVAGWYGSTPGSWETITIPISDFINVSGGTYEINTFDASAASALVFLEDHTATDGQDYLFANIRIE